MSASVAVLGLLIDRPDDVPGLERRLAECFPLARFSSTTAHSAVKRLVSRGHVCELERSQAAGREVSEGAQYARVKRALGEGGMEAGLRMASSGRKAVARDRYGPTRDGAAFFRRWMGSACPVPAVREELRGKLMFARPPDIPRLIELVSQEIEACAREYEALHTSIMAIEQHRKTSAGGEEEWPVLTRLVVLRDDADFWLMRANRLKRTSAYLRWLLDRWAGHSGSAPSSR